MVDKEEKRAGPETDELGRHGGLITVPRWVQLATLPVLLIITWYLLGAAAQAVVMFVLATLIALVLNPLVRALERIRIPRYVGVFVVYAVFLGLLVGLVALLIPPLTTQARNLIHSIPSMADGARNGIDSLQRLADRLKVNIDVRAEINSFAASLDKYIPVLSKGVYGVGRSLITTIALGFITIVISIYMLLDSRRISRYIARHFPTRSQADGDEYVTLAQQAVVSYVKAQLILSIALGASAGLAMWVLGVTGVFPSGADYALFFGAWTALMEFIPYLGPVLAAVPPTVVGLLHSPLTALWVILTFLAIQQIEGHILTPTIMGSRFRVHPLIVIFAILVGGELYGLVGMFIAIPLIPLTRETIVFLRPRVKFEGWRAATLGIAEGSAGGEPPALPSSPAPDEHTEDHSS